MVAIGSMAVDDLREAFLLGNDSWGGHAMPFPGMAWDEETFAALYHKNPWCCIVAKRKNRLLGFIIGVEGDGDGQGYLLWCAVRPHHRSEKTVADMYNLLASRMRERGSRRIVLLDTIPDRAVLDSLLEAGLRPAEPLRRWAAGLD